MHLIDRYAYSNRLRQADPAQKAGLAAAALADCLLLDRPLVGLFTVAWLWIIAVRLAGLPGRAFGAILLAEGLFLALSATGVAVAISLAPPPAAWRLAIGGLWLSSSPAQLELALRVLTRALGGAAVLNLLALTTPLADLIDLLRRLRCPELLIDLMTLVYRFIFTLLESLARMTAAQQSRLGYSSPRRAMRSAALTASRLFIEALQRSRRLQIALESRAYAGALRVLPNSHRLDKRLWWWGAGLLAGQLGMWAVGR